MIKLPRTLPTILLALLAACAVSSCSSGSSSSTSSSATTIAVDPNAKPPTPKPDAGQWGYSGADGPTHWSDLSPKYKACGDGKLQSPIDLVGARSGDSGSFTLNYSPEGFEVMNNGHDIAVAALRSEDTLEAVDGSNPDAPLTDTS